MQDLHWSTSWVILINDRPRNMIHALSLKGKIVFPQAAIIVSGGGLVRKPGPPPLTMLPNATFSTAILYSAYCTSKYATFVFYER